MFEPYERLANAIIIRAIKDYRMKGGTAEANPEKKEIIDWIRSPFFSAITDLNPEVLIGELQKEDKKKWERLNSCRRPTI